MKEKSLTPLMRCHLALMAVLAVMSIVSIVSLLSGAVMSGAMLPARYKTSMIFEIVLNVVNVIALSAGIVYIQERYGKRAAAVYKAFLVSAAVSCVFCAVTGAYRLTAADAVPAAQYVLRAVLPMAVKLVLLLLLAFGRDLGKRNSWIIFGVILVLDVIYSLLCIVPGDMGFAWITTVFARLVMDGTIGLSIRGKYADKDARGTT